MKLTIVYILMIVSSIYGQQNKNNISPKQVIPPYEPNGYDYTPVAAPEYNYGGYQNNTVMEPPIGLAPPIGSAPPTPPILGPPKPKRMMMLPTDDPNGINVMDKIMEVNDQQGMLATPETQGDGTAVFEGDIIKTMQLNDAVKEMKHLEQVGLKAFDAINGGQWPSAVVPYTFNGRFSGRSVVYRAIAEFKKHTCIRFVPRTNQRAYVEFMHGGGCSSYIGRQGGKQQISLAGGCLVTGIAIHEMMHALGFFHEQSRRDRDSYITINWNNINPATRYNFEKYRSGRASTLGEPYDKKSVMHYGNYAFSINGRKTIVSKSNYNEVLGQRAGMSKTDINQLNKYYKCKDTGTGGGGTKPPPEERLKDKYPFCVSLKSWCSKDNFVRINCVKSCCKDKNKYCSYWRREGYCVSKTWREWMKGNCPKSCEYC